MIFYQRTARFDSLSFEINALNEKQRQKPTDSYNDQLTELINNQVEELYKCLNKKVWIKISTINGGYYNILR